jgi:hypothetical protein
MTAASSTPAATSSYGRMTAFWALVLAMVSFAAFWEFQKSGAAASSSRAANIFLRLAMSKIASHFHQSFAQLGEPGLYFFYREHIMMLRCYDKTKLKKAK